MPVGRGTYGRFLEIRVFDFWVHVRDITSPLGRPTDDAGIAAEIALAQVEDSIGYIVGKKIGLPDGKQHHLQAHRTGHPGDQRRRRRAGEAGRRARQSGRRR